MVGKRNKKKVDLAIHQPLTNDLDWKHFDIEITKAVGLYGITGKQLQMIQLCLRPVLLEAYWQGVNKFNMEEQDINIDISNVDKSSTDCHNNSVTISEYQ